MAKILSEPRHARQPCPFPSRAKSLPDTLEIIPVLVPFPTGRATPCTSPRTVTAHAFSGWAVSPDSPRTLCEYGREVPEGSRLLPTIASRPPERQPCAKLAAKQAIIYARALVRGFRHNARCAAGNTGILRAPQVAPKLTLHCRVRLRTAALRSRKRLGLLPQGAAVDVLLQELPEKTFVR